MASHNIADDTRSEVYSILPPYEGAAESSKRTDSTIGPLPSALRTLHIEYTGKAGGNLRVLDSLNDADPHVLYAAKTHFTKLLSGAHVEFTSGSEKEKLGSAAFHKVSPRIDLKLHGDAVTMTGSQGTYRSVFSWQSVTGLGRLTWKRSVRMNMELTCVNEQQVPLADLRWGTTAKAGTGKLDIFVPDIAKGGKDLDEIVFSGLAYLHLSLYMNMYAGSGSASTIAIN